MFSNEKLTMLANIEGFEDSMQMLEEIMVDSVNPGICTNEDCDYTTEVEPDQDKGYCEVCGTQTVKSALILANII